MLILIQCLNSGGIRLLFTRKIEMFLFCNFSKAANILFVAIVYNPFLHDDYAGTKICLVTTKHFPNLVYIFFA